MRKGQMSLAPNFFTDIILGTLIIILSFALLSKVTSNIQTTPAELSYFQDASDRTLLTVLSSQIQSFRDFPEYHSLINNFYTYGDLLFLPSLDSRRASQYTDYFSSSLPYALHPSDSYPYIRSLSSTYSQWGWFINISITPELLIASRGESFDPSFLDSLKPFPSHLSFYYPSQNKPAPVTITYYFQQARPTPGGAFL